jgi:hypothetical protein
MYQRTTKKHRLSYAQLENRKLLAGAVFVDLVGDNLVVIGNSDHNVFSIDLNATTTGGLVTGQDNTSVRYSSDFDSVLSLGQLQDVRIYSGDGNDVVSVMGTGFVASDDFTVSLGDGHDSLYVLGGEFQDDGRLFGGRGHDSIALDGTMFGDYLTIATLNGHDVVGLNGVDVQGQTRFLTYYGHDTVLINESRFGAQVYSEMSTGDDTFESVNSNFENVISVRGRLGYDSTMLNGSNEFAVDPHRFMVERVATAPNELGEVIDAIDDLKSDFFQFGNEFPQTIGSGVQSGLSELADAFNVALISLGMNSNSQTVYVEDPTPTLSVLWDAAVQNAVSATGPGPTIASRAYSMLHTAMYDAWSAYDNFAISTTVGDTLQRPLAENTEANKKEAMSYAAFRVLDDLFSTQTATFENVMTKLGLDSSVTSTDVTTAVGIGNRMAQELLAIRHDDGSNQLGDSTTGTAGVAYSDTTGYSASNPVGDPTDMDSWTPEYVPIDSDPGTETRIQEFLTPHWGTVESFSLSSSDEFRPVAPQSFLLVDGTVDLNAKTITLTDGTVLDIDESLVGTVINPEFISQAEEVVEWSAELTDEKKLIAEFWEDGGGTSFPPGTFMTFGQFVSARDDHSIDDDAKMFLALSNAVFDAGVATWESKVAYDYVRPVRAIRELGELGLIGEFDSDLDGYAIEAWTPEDGTQTILATEFLTYQTPGSDPSPPFAEYTSGHSAFSTAGATILELFTGSDEFNASVNFAAGSSRFEPGITPLVPTTLSWDTFTDAADEAGESRLYGGIHFTEGDLNGRQLGEEIGNSVWEQAQFYINGGA